MNPAEKVAPSLGEPWAQICEQYPDEWVLLVDVEKEPLGAIKAARVVGHHRSMNELLKQGDLWSDHAAVTYSHTRGRMVRRPRIVMTDEIRDLIRPRR